MRYRNPLTGRYSKSPTATRFAASGGRLSIGQRLRIISPDHPHNGRTVEVRGTSPDGTSGHGLLLYGHGETHVGFSIEQVSP
jgi:hypothetical protein